MKIILCILVLFCYYGNCEKKYTICIGEKMFNQTIVCHNLNHDEHSKVECIIAKDRLDCLKYLTNNVADFTVLHPEELIIAKNMLAKIRVTHELQKFINVSNDYDVVGLVSYRISVTSLTDLKDVRMCSVGFDQEKGHDFDWNELFSKFIEDQVVPQHCNSNLSYIENRIDSVESFFGPSCKAGKWVLDSPNDALLKKQYPGLCALCDDPISCSNKDKYWGRRGAAYCMTDCLGDVAWLRLDDWETHVKTTPNKLCQDFFYLCPDGSVQLSSQENPCKWISQPLPTIVVREDISQSVHHIITDVARSSPLNDVNTTWMWSTRNLISPFSRYIVELENMFTPNYYLNKAKNYLTAREDESGCDNEHYAIHFCVQSKTELLKCQYMSEVAQAYGISPDIECVMFKNCADALSKNMAEVMSVGTDDYEKAMSLNKHLVPILYALDDNLDFPFGFEHQRSPFDNSYRYSIAVVKKSSHIKSFDQLKGKTACFAKYNDFGWNSVLYQLIEDGLLPNICPYEEALKSYFGDVCAISTSNSSVVRQCDERVDPEFTKHESYIQSEVLQCLFVGGGDVAFIDHKFLHTTMPNEHEWLFKTSDYQYEMLCPNGGSQDNGSCYMYWSTQGQILAHTNMTKDRVEEISNTLKSVKFYFGENSRIAGTPSESFKLFHEFEEQENILFQDNTKSFEDFRSINNSFRNMHRNYEKVVVQYGNCDVNRNHSPNFTKSLGRIILDVLLTLVVISLVSPS